MKHVRLESLFKQDYGRLVALLTRRFGPNLMTDIEDAVQFAVLQAADTWRDDSVPDNTSAWLYLVASRHLINTLKTRDTREKTHSLFSDTLNEHSSILDDVPLKNELDDALLNMMIVVCECDIPLESQIVFILRVLMGFTTKEIALRLFKSEDNVYKRYYRAKNALEQQLGANGFPQQPTYKKLERVHWVLYLIFTEGHMAATQIRLNRSDICYEALRLVYTLSHHSIGKCPASFALMALMQFHCARIEGREDELGGLLLLDHQDRSKWDRELIHKGFESLANSASGTRLTRYHVEASIAAEHCRANDLASTDWEKIAGQYALLQSFTTSPLILLNRAIAMAKWKGAAYGLKVLESVPEQTGLERSFHWDAVKAWLLLKNHNVEPGLIYAQQAIEKAQNTSVKELLIKRFESFGLRLCLPDPET